MMHFARQKPAQKLLLIFLTASSAQAYALGLGPITLQSGLGNPLQARIPLYGVAGEELQANCIKIRVTALDGDLLSRPTAQLMGSNADAAIKIIGRESIAEPAVNVVVEIGCASVVKREYQVLLDPLPVAQWATTATEPLRPARTERPAAQKKAIVVAPTIAAPAPSTAPALHKPLPPSKAKSAPAAKSVLTLSTGDAEIEQVRTNLVLRYATTLSEPRLETDAIRLAAMRADQARVAALIRGEAPSAAIEAQLQNAQRELRLARQSTLASKQELETQQAALSAERQSLVPKSWLGILAGLMAASVAATAWLLRRRTEDKRRHQHELMMLSAALNTPSDSTDTAPEVSTPVAVGPANPLPPVTATDLDVVPTTPPTPATEFDCNDKSTDFIVAPSVPQSLQIPESWLAIEQQISDLRDHQPDSSGLAVHNLMEEGTQNHASEVASLLLAAENWMTEHQPLRAADVLRPYLERQDMLSPAPVLYLMALYQTVGDLEQLKTVQALLKQYFPEEAAQWHDGKQERRGIAAFPEVRAMIDALNQDSALLPYLNGLLLAPERFDFSAYRDIVRAIGLAKETVETREMKSMSLDFN